MEPLDRNFELQIIKAAGTGWAILKRDKNADFCIVYNVLIGKFCPQFDRWFDVSLDFFVRSETVGIGSLLVSGSGVGVLSGSGGWGVVGVGGGGGKCMWGFA